MSTNNTKQDEGPMVTEASFDELFDYLTRNWTENGFQQWQVDVVRGVCMTHELRANWKGYQEGYAKGIEAALKQVGEEDQ